MEQKLVVKWYNRIDSTNLQARRELSSLPEISEGIVWVADFQTAGRGQRGNSWESCAGKNLLFTVLLRPFLIEASKQFSISQITALAVVRYLKNKGLDARIKWPNDIYVGDKKICGILIEHTLSGANLSASILGIGININQTLFESDAPNPTSLLLELERIGAAGGKELSRRDELNDLLVSLFSLYDALCNGAEEQINEEYLSCLYRFDDNFYSFMEPHPDGNNIVISAKIKGINRYGCLILEKEDGSVSEYAFQQIRYIL